MAIELLENMPLIRLIRIPFERALDFANKEKITELLYPLFVHNIGALLYHPSNQTRTTQVMAAAERRKQEQQQQQSMRNGNPPAGLPSINHHHHSIGMTGAPQPPLSSQQARPSLDRAQSFPTPPTSASSGMGSMGGSESFTAYPPLPPSAPPMSIDTTLTSTRSMPNTPATTPPGNSIQTMHPSYPQPPVSQPYDGSRQMYSAPAPQQSPYQQPANSSYSQSTSSGYPKTEMGPPSSRPAGAVGEHAETKPNSLSQSGEPTPHVTAEEEGDHDSQEAEYTHGRPAYNYSASAVGPMSNEQHLAPELTNSPSHQAGSGRATPRTTATQGYYPQSSGYTPPSVQQSSSNLYSVISDDRTTSNGAAASNSYAPQGEMTNGYGSHPSVMNGGSGSIKRGRDDDDDNSMDFKRRKTLNGLSEGIPPQYPSMATAPPVGGAPRRR